jgi:hypothetical protein
MTEADEFTIGDLLDIVLSCADQQPFVTDRILSHPLDQPKN